MQDAIPLHDLANSEEMQAEITKSHLDGHLLELVRLRAAQIHQCDSSVVKHQEQLRAVGETERRIGDLPHWNDSVLFSAQERAALALCEKITCDPEQPLAGNLMCELRHCFTKSEIVSLTISVMAVEDWIVAYS